MRRWQTVRVVQHVPFVVFHFRPTFPGTLCTTFTHVLQFVQFTLREMQHVRGLFQFDRQIINGFFSFHQQHLHFARVPELTHMVFGHLKTTASFDLATTGV